MLHPAWDCHFPKIPLTQIETASFFAPRIVEMWGYGVGNLPQWLPDPADPTIHRSAIYGQCTARWCAAWTINRDPKCELRIERQCNWVPPAGNGQLANSSDNKWFSSGSGELRKPGPKRFVRLCQITWKVKVVENRKTGAKGEAGGAAGDQIHLDK